MLETNLAPSIYFFLFSRRACYHREQPWLLVPHFVGLDHHGVCCHQEAQKSTVFEALSAKVQGNILFFLFLIFFSNTVLSPDSSSVNRSSRVAAAAGNSYFGLGFELYHC